MRRSRCDTRATRKTAPRRGGVTAAILGLVGLAAFAWTWILSATPIDPPEWLRIVGVWLMPIGIFGALIAGIAGLRGPGRPWAIVGLVLAGVTIVAFVLLISLWEY
jgi:hypothetical protein